MKNANKTTRRIKVAVISTTFPAPGLAVLTLANGDTQERQVNPRSAIPAGWMPWDYVMVTAPA